MQTDKKLVNMPTMSAIVKFYRKQGFSQMFDAL